MAADDNTAKDASSGSAGASGSKQSLILMALAAINMAVVGGVGFMMYQSRQKEAAQPKIEHVIQGEHQAQSEEAADNKVAKLPVVPLETFTVNLAGSKGRRIFRVDLELEVSDRKVVDEIEQRKPQVRDIIIIILSGRTYDQISSKEGKNELRDEIKDTVNAFLAKGKITNVYFTNLLFN